MVPACYEHPSNPKIKLWDVPGVGSKTQGAATYWEKMELDKCDAYLIFTSCRFSENDGILANKVHSVGKKFFFVRAKIDVDLNNAAYDQGLKPLADKQEHKEPLNDDAASNQGSQTMTKEKEREELLKIREDCLKNLKGVEGNLVEVYLISNRSTEKWDFSRLTKAICDALPSLQRESVILTLQATSIEMLHDKVEILRRRILEVALLSSSVALVPLPGVSVIADIVLILRQIRRYKSNLGIPDEGTTQYSMLRTSTQQFIRQTCAHIATTKGVQDLLRLYATEQVLEEVSRLIPFVGYLGAACMSFVCTYKCLHHSLDIMKETAINVLTEKVNIPGTD